MRARCSRTPAWLAVTPSCAAASWFVSPSRHTRQRGPCDRRVTRATLFRRSTGPLPDSASALHQRERVQLRRTARGGVLLVTTQGLHAPLDITIQSVQVDDRVAVPVSGPGQ